MTNKWDKYFLGICEAVAKKSSCLSRKIGAILVRNNAIVATAYNGPPIGIPHCDSQQRRNYFAQEFPDKFPKDYALIKSDECPRQLMGFESGKGLDLCIAAHAERNLLNQCARLGVPVEGTSLYMNAVVFPCKECFLELIQCKIKTIVCIQAEPYNEITWLLKHSNITVRECYI
jgi:dCMP deaminase